MTGITDLIHGDLGKEIISGIGNQVGTSENETTAVLSSALPSLINAMQNNASSEQGAQGLLGALLGGQHESLLDNLGGLLQSGNLDTNDGGNILNHVLGENQSDLENKISQTTGVSSDKIAQILKLAAPVLMAFLANKAKSGEVQSGNDLGNWLGGLLGNQGNLSGNGSLLTSVLDQDGDGQLGINDAVTAVSKKGGLGGLLGSLFGKK
ncbi:DUF937 domain-containing protein [Flavobacterium luminosum]|uniref:DUF937 domain-containing protein n=1 Tax=Flavobacterium luminosum TaxID=2949086 RepID=A0ABT0TPK4_9FLAO|nr:DUF937 domain-containing protein [Flavobacterium sp. HXWNR70]MCL9809423.1 DUF937 domain-containing protein [Flavobacterium sp. HXWNR70]